MKKFLILIYILSYSTLELFSMCSPVGYTNLTDGLCNGPVVTQDGACVNGTNVGLINCAGVGCLTAGLAQDFMQFTTTSTSVIVDFTSTGISTADVGLATTGSGGCSDHVSDCPTLSAYCLQDCGTSTGTNPYSITFSGLIIGETYALIIESTFANQGTYSLCVSTDPCSNGIQDGSETGVDCGGSCSPCPATNDDCATNIGLTLDQTEFIGSGAGNACTQTLCSDGNTEDCYIYTGPPCNPGCCLYSYMSCGSVENNTWYTYTPGTTDSFHFALVNQVCTDGNGMQ